MSRVQDEGLQFLVIYPKLMTRLSLGTVVRGAELSLHASCSQVPEGSDACENQANSLAQSLFLEASRTAHASALASYNLCTNKSCVSCLLWPRGLGIDQFVLLHLI
jgi:hypothetical protein